MKKPNVTTIFKDLQIYAVRRSPEILTGLGIAGMISAIVLAVKATPKAIDILNEEADRRIIEENPVAYDEGHDDVREAIPINVLDTIKLTWKCYIPVVISGTVSVACLIGANSVNARRNAALATAYKLSEAALSEYKDKVIETIGEKKEQVVRDSIAQDKMEQNPVNTKEIIITGDKNTLCLDGISNRYFTSDMETIRRAVNNINRDLLSQDYISLNEFYDEIGLEHIPVGDDLGWNISRDGLIELKYSSAISSDGRPCLVLDYYIEPRYDYSKLI